MYFQFLIEDRSTEILVDHVMKKMKHQHSEKEICWNIKSFGGIGHLQKRGTALEQKTGKLLNDLPMYMRGFDKVLQKMEKASLIIVLDNDKRDIEQFRNELENLVSSNKIVCDCVFCVAIKEMEAWLLGDAEAIKEAYPDARMQCLKRYRQDAICETWEVLADMVYPKGLSRLKKKAGDTYAEIGKAKCEWADKIGRCLHLYKNQSPSYRHFIDALEKRVFV